MNKPTLLTLLGMALAALGGLGLGYLFFHTEPQAMESGAHQHSEAEQIWTCSMHPQIRQNEPGDCPICGMELIPLAENSSTDPLVLEMTPEAVKLAQIETTVIGSTGRAENVLRLSGKIQPDERLSASQVAHIPGRIEKLYVSFTGEQIYPGQKLATIYSPELLTAQQELLEAVKLKTTNPGLLVAARQKLAYWKIPAEQIQALESSGEVQPNFTLIADAGGIVTGKRVSVGDYVKQGEVLFDLVSLARVWVLLDAYEADLAQIRVGDVVRFQTPALPNQTFETRISFIDPVINPATRVASIRGEVLNRKGLLKPEMLVQGQLQSARSANEQLLVPRSAVLWTGKRSVVYVQVEGANVPSFQFREITLGERVGESYLVEAGLESGEAVVSYGSFTLDAAAQLNNQASMMNRTVAVEGQSVATAVSFVASTPPAFQQQLAVVVRSYIPLKDALVATDPDKAEKAAQDFLTALESVEMSLLKGDAHLFWMDQLTALRAHGQTIAEQTDVVKQREQFRFLSTALISSIQALGIRGDTLYVQHCPMANNFNGADWISAQREILNPYFGDEMLSCGSVTGTLPVDLALP